MTNSLITTFVTAAHYAADVIALGESIDLPSNGQITQAQISAIIGIALTKTKEGWRQQKENRNKSNRDLLEASLKEYIDNLKNDVDEFEASFEDRFGDAWRENIALLVLEEHVPQRREDESIDQYRERLEDALIAKMLNEDGSIKEKYYNNAELREYAEWAQKVYFYEKALDLSHDIKHNPNSPTMKQLEDKANSELALNVADQLGGHSKQEEALGVDTKIDLGASENNQDEFTREFFKP